VNERLKHRLLGAAILIALGVLLLPGFFRDKENYQIDTQSQIPEKPSITTLDFDGPTAVDTVEPAPSPDTMFVPAETPLEEVGFSSSSVSSSVASVDSAADPVLPQAWVIQVASLGNKEAAEKLMKTLQTEGHKAYLRTVMTDKGSMHRVFIGPKLDRKDADVVKQAVDKQFNLTSKIYPYDAKP
jgi:DedD protein